MNHKWAVICLIGAVTVFMMMQMKHLAASIVSDLPEFPRLERMLDLGGDPGLKCMAIVNAYPGLKGTVFDFPAVTRKTRDYIRHYGLDDRITALSGDFNQVDLGCGYYLIWASGGAEFF